MARQRTSSGRAYLPGELALREALLPAGAAVAAAYRRRLRDTVFVGITGSVGKTTTKELTAAVLAAELPGTRSPGGSNKLSSIGRTILATRPEHRSCVLEVAAWRPGSVAQIARLVRPQVAVVTRIGADHYRAFRGAEGAAEEKRALVEALPPNGVAVLNADDPHAITMADACSGRVISFGESADATLRAEDVRASWPDPLAFMLHTGGRSLPVRTRLHGRQSLTSVLAALGVAEALGLALEPALEAVAAFEPVAGRMSPVRQGGVCFVRDDRKASVWSFDPVLEFLAEARASRKILVAGTLSDYAGSSTRAYVGLARRALEVADEVAFVGRQAERVRKLDESADGRLRRFETVREAAAYFGGSLRDGDLVVLKGSNRSDHLVRILLAREREVRCWRESCGRQTFCEDCRLL